MYRFRYPPPLAAGLLFILGSAYAREDTINVNVAAVANESMIDADGLFDIETFDHNTMTLHEIESIETFDDVNATLLETLDESTTNLVFKLKNLNFSNIVLEPSSMCSRTSHFCIDVPTKERTGSTYEELLVAMKEKYPHFSDEWWDKGIGLDIEKRYELYKDANKLSISAINDGELIQMYGVGMVVDNVNFVDHLAKKFTVSVKIYLFKIEPEDQPTSLKEAYGNARSKDFSVVRFENKVNSDQPYYELLEAPWSEVKDDPRYKEASPVVNDFCSRAHHKRMRLLTIDEYNALKPGLEILHASSSPSAVEDDKGNLLHLVANGVTILFDSMNSEFFPFQTDLLDVNLYLPQHGLDRSMFCVDNHFTGLLMPMEGHFGRKKNTEKNYLSLIPYIRSTYAPPFLGRGTRQMRNNYGKWAELNNDGNKVVHTATFRILHIPDYDHGLQAAVPFLFIILSTYAQWFATTPDAAMGVSDMISSALQLNTVVSAQKDYLEYRNKLTNVIYLTYVVVVAKILAAAFMASVSASAVSGKYPRLVRHRSLIFRAMRLLAFLSSFFLLPILHVETDVQTGQQYQNIGLYYFVGILILAIMALFFIREYRTSQRSKLELKEKAEKDEEIANTINDAQGPVEDWSAEEVAKWIGSERVRENASLTKGELEGIAAKFEAAKIKGEVFNQIAYDEDKLLKVGLSVGEAVLFVHSMNKLDEQTFDTSHKMQSFDSSDKMHADTARVD